MRKEGKRSGTARRRPCVRKGAALPSKSRKQLGARGASPWTKSGLSKLAIQNLRRASKVLDLQGVSCVRFCTRAKRKTTGHANAAPCCQPIPFQETSHPTATIVFMLIDRQARRTEGRSLQGCPSKPLRPEKERTLPCKHFGMYASKGDFARSQMRPDACEQKGTGAAKAGRGDQRQRVWHWFTITR